MVAPHKYRQAIIVLWSLGDTPAQITNKLGIPRQTVHRTIARYKQLGTYMDRPGKGRPRTVLTQQLKDTVKKKVKRNPKRSIRKMAKQLKISKTSMSRMVHEGLKGYPYKMRKRHGLTDVHKEKRLKRCKLLLKRAVRGDHLMTLYSDEKVFTLEETYNPQNTRIIARTAKEADDMGRSISRVAHPQSIMVWAGVCATGKTPLVFVKPGAKINKEYYIKEILVKHLLPWSRSHFKGARWTFQQDSAPAHMAKVTQKWCATHLPDFIRTEEWPSNSPDLNPLDFSVWAVLEKEACSVRHPTLDSLRAALKKAWDQIDTDYLRRVIESVPTRLRKVIAANGGQIE